MLTRTLGVCICWSLDAILKSDPKDLITVEDLLLLCKNRPRNGIVIENKKKVCCSYSICHILYLNSSVIRLVRNYSVFKFNKDSHYRKNREVEIMERREALRRGERERARGQPEWKCILPSPTIPFCLAEPCKNRPERHEETAFSNFSLSASFCQ